MLDHFGLLAPIYDRVIRPPDVERLCHLLELPAPVRMLDAEVFISKPCGGPSPWSPLYKTFLQEEGFVNVLYRVLLFPD